MKIVLSTSAADITAEIDPRFGRGSYLLLVDLDTMEWQAYLNPALYASGGAGIQTAQFVTSHQAQAVISGDFGPHAFEALKAAGVAMYHYGEARTASEAIQRFKAGQLRPAGLSTRPAGDNRRPA